MKSFSAMEPSPLKMKKIIGTSRLRSKESKIGLFVLVIAALSLAVSFSAARSRLLRESKASLQPIASDDHWESQ